MGNQVCKPEVHRARMQMHQESVTCQEGTRHLRVGELRSGDSERLVFRGKAPAKAHLQRALEYLLQPERFTPRLVANG